MQTHKDIDAQSSIDSDLKVAALTKIDTHTESLEADFADWR
jgi:hypothetical protein